MEFDLPSFSQAEIKYFPTSTKQNAPTVCQVCLGKATGHHYDVASCNGCKSFFRRVIIEKLNYKCGFTGNCFEHLSLRVPGEHAPKCRACRFNKCVEVGMNPLGIQSEMGREYCMNNTPEVKRPLVTIDGQVEELIDRMIRLDVQSEKFGDCAFNPHRFPSLKECLKEEISILSIADKYGPMPGWPLQKDTIDEHCQLTKTKSGHHPTMKRWTAYELLIQIELCKALPFFSDLSESDRFHLIQDTVLMSSNLTIAFNSFEKKSDKPLRRDGVGFFDYGFPCNDEYRARFREDIGIRCLTAILREGLDRVEFVLLRVLVLTNPAVPELSKTAQNYLTKERQKYNIALFRYIMVKHGLSGPARFANILGFIDLLEHQQRDHRDISMLMNLIKPRRGPASFVDDVMRH